MKVYPLLFNLEPPQPTTREIANRVKQVGTSLAMPEAAHPADGATYQEVTWTQHQEIMWAQHPGKARRIAPCRLQNLWIDAFEVNPKFEELSSSGYRLLFDNMISSHARETRQAEQPGQITIELLRFIVGITLFSYVEMIVCIEKGFHARFHGFPMRRDGAVVFAVVAISPKRINSKRAGGAAEPLQC